MAYIGQGIKNGTFTVLDTSGNTYNGSNATFDLGTQVGSPAQLLVSHDGVLQKPGTDYTLASNGTQITFTTEPASGASIFIIEISGAVGGPMNRDLNGEELILDVDGDTSITADTDDQIDFKIAGADDLRMTANAINVLSGTTLTIDSGATITNSGTANGFGTDPDGAQVFNESGADVDFRVETNSNANMLFISGGNDVVGIGAEGDLGVGLHVKSADSGASVSGDADEAVFEASGHGGITLLNGTSHEGSINFGDSGDNDIGRLTYDHSADAMFMITNGSIRQKIDSSGVALFQCTSTVSSSVQGTQIANSNSGSKFGGGSGTTNQNLIIFFNGNGEVGKIHTSGSGTTYATSSDYRLKENVDYTWDATTRLKQLKPARFNFKADTDTTLDGFLAHEVSSIVPDAVTGVKDETENKRNVVLNPVGDVAAEGITEAEWTQGKADGIYLANSTWHADTNVPVYQAIDQSKLVPLLVKTVQELEARIATLEG